MAPPNLRAASGSYLEVDIAADSAAQPSWREPIRTYFRRTPGGWTLVGLERLPQKVASAVVGADAKP
jgi:hypothetical protein